MRPSLPMIMSVIGPSCPVYVAMQLPFYVSNAFIVQSSEHDNKILSVFVILLSILNSYDCSLIINLVTEFLWPSKVIRHSPVFTSYFLDKKSSEQVYKNELSLFKTISNTSFSWPENVIILLPV